ncbi:TIGR02647 family protein [Venatoribacter cucullus]|uniref:TIGR02647 family protein n=1 Tax=Venatoribacter cucullus TaxID=2661630 RepID=A0A9E8FIR2_9GAMM|nr:TIGR02647 family protein [Venatoribacter cucullus]QQD20493.1 TIGR02647 family protein [Oceanospirillaceae bacterium ASx5O]QQD23196.1 TIGR02647 family protein [Venatoribacter cucullus]UZK02629.1 TIGR02647 family protein [Venatoribacter cucullus]
MAIPVDLLHEMNLLAHYDLHSMQKGIKVHSDAGPEMIAAAQRLHQKGLIDQPDGGYLTTLGHDAAEHVQNLLQILRG